MSECSRKQGNGIISEGVSSVETLWKGMEHWRRLEKIGNDWKEILHNIGGLVNSNTFNKMHGSETEGGYWILSDQSGVQKMVLAKFSEDMLEQTDQANGTEKVLAQYPTISRLKMGRLVVSRNQQTRRVKLESVTIFIVFLCLPFFQKNYYVCVCICLQFYFCY